MPEHHRRRLSAAAVAGAGRAEQGAAVIIDAVYDRRTSAMRWKSWRGTQGVPFVGIWLEAAPEILRQRVRDRRKGSSDANAEVLEAQLQRPVGEITWVRLDSTLPDLEGRALALAKAAMGEA